MTQFDYDLFVIGAGSGGVRAARIAAQNGARVAIAEEYRIGGTCVIRGCVPKKLLVYGAEFAQVFKDAAGFGWNVGAPRFDWATLRDNVQAEVARLSAIYEANLAKAGVTVLQSRATIDGPQTVRLGDGRTLSAKRILVATGGRPVLPDAPGSEHVISSNEAFLLPELPKRVLIAGAGYIALEFATIFNGLGVETHLLYRGDKILKGFDDDVRAHVQAEMQRQGVTIHTQVIFKAIEKTPTGLVAHLTNGASIEADVIMAALGRKPYIKGLGLERAGVELDHEGAIEVDRFSQTNVASIYAVGDVTNRVNLTPVAIREGHAFADTVYRNLPMAVDHADIPTAVFSSPPVGAVGLTEKQARAHFAAVHIYKTNFRPMKNILAGNEQRTLMKLVVDAATDRVVGVHIAGPDGPEMVQLAAIAVKAGLTKAQWDQTVALHPTAAEELVLLKERAG
jgi:glutathione reductase (NADPH)